MIVLQALTGKVAAGSDTVQCPQQKLGGLLITADGTNTVTVTVRKTNAEGELIIDAFQTRSSMFLAGPFDTAPATAIHYTLAGAGGGMQVFAWKDVG